MLGLGIWQVVPDQILSAWQWYLIMPKSHLWLATITQSTFKIATLNRFCTNIGSPCLPLNIISQHCLDLTSWRVVNSFAVTIFTFLERTQPTCQPPRPEHPPDPFCGTMFFNLFRSHVPNSRAKSAFWITYFPKPKSLRVFRMNRRWFFHCSPSLKISLEC